MLNFSQFWTTSDFDREYLRTSSGAVAPLTDYPHETFSVDVQQKRGDKIGTIFGRPASKNLGGQKKLSKIHSDF